jgi:mannose/fructose/N-acetylgalactosamine-specific phosphotransferase system component IID
MGILALNTSGGMQGLIFFFIVVYMIFVFVNEFSELTHAYKKGKITN